MLLTLLWPPTTYQCLNNTLFTYFIFYYNNTHLFHVCKGNILNNYCYKRRAKKWGSSFWGELQICWRKNLSSSLLHPRKLFGNFPIRKYGSRFFFYIFQISPSILPGWESFRQVFGVVRGFFVLFCVEFEKKRFKWYEEWSFFL